MCHVIHDITSDAPAVSEKSGIPVEVKNRVRNFPEWKSKGHKQSWGHDQAILVHRQIVVNAVKEEVSSNPNPIVRKPLVNMEQKAVHSIFQQSPHKKTKDKESDGSSRIVQPSGTDRSTIRDARHPQNRYDIPGSLRKRFQKVSKQGGRLPPFIVPWPVDLIKVEFLRETTEPDLRKQRLRQI